MSSRNHLGLHLLFPVLEWWWSNHQPVSTHIELVEDTLWCVTQGDRAHILACMPIASMSLLTIGIWSLFHPILESEMALYLLWHMRWSRSHHLRIWSPGSELLLSLSCLHESVTYVWADFMEDQGAQRTASTSHQMPGGAPRLSSSAKFPVTHLHELPPD